VFSGWQLFVPAMPLAQGSQTPLWSINLSAFGAGDPSLSIGAARSTLWLRVTGIAFTKPNVLAAYFITRGSGGVLARRDQPAPSDPYHLRVVLFGASDGKRQSELQWSTEPLLVDGLYPAGDGNFIVRTANSLDLYSDSLKLEKQIPLLPTSGTRTRWDQQLSPDQKTIILHRSVDSQNAFTLLRANDLSELFSWSDENYGFSSYDESVLWSKHFHDVILGAGGKESHTIYYSPGVLCSTPVFLNQANIVLQEQGHNACRVLEIISRDGKRIAIQDFKGELLSKKMSISVDGSTLAVATESVHGTWFDAPLDRTWVRLRTYSTALGVWRIALDGLQPAPQFFYSFALSPDGGLLAVLSDTTVSVYRLDK
jgi:hypothetical protein